MMGRRERGQGRAPTMSLPPRLSRKAVRMSKPIDYDAPRRPLVEVEDDRLDGLRTRSSAAQSPQVDLEDADSFQPPEADLTGEEDFEGVLRWVFGAGEVIEADTVGDDVDFL